MAPLVPLESCNNINSSTDDKMHHFVQRTGGVAPSASPSRRPDTGPAQADATAGWEGRPHSAEPEPRSTPPRSCISLTYF